MTEVDKKHPVKSGNPWDDAECEEYHKQMEPVVHEPKPAKCNLRCGAMNARWDELCDECQADPWVRERYGKSAT